MLSRSHSPSQACTRDAIMHAQVQSMAHRTCFPVSHSAPANRIVLGKLFVKFKTKCLRVLKWICIKFESMGKDEKVPSSEHTAECAATFCFRAVCLRATGPCSPASICHVYGEKIVEINCEVMAMTVEHWTKTWSAMLSIDKIFIFSEWWSVAVDIRARILSIFGCLPRRSNTVFDLE